MAAPKIHRVTRELFGLHNRSVLIAWDEYGPIMGIVVKPRDPVAWEQKRPTAADKRRMERSVAKEFGP